MKQKLSHPMIILQENNNNNNNNIKLKLNRPKKIIILTVLIKLFKQKTKFHSLFSFFFVLK
jgi:hypothetical protein